MSLVRSRANKQWNKTGTTLNTNSSNQNRARSVKSNYVPYNKNKLINSLNNNSGLASSSGLNNNSSVNNSTNNSLNINDNITNNKNNYDLSSQNNYEFSPQNNYEFSSQTNSQFDLESIVQTNDTSINNSKANSVILDPISNYSTTITTYIILILDDSSENFEELIHELYNQNERNFLLNIVNNNCGMYSSHKIELMEKKYSKNNNIKFTKSNDNVIKIINDNIINFLLDKSLNYFTWINVNCKYNKGVFKMLQSNNNFFSYSNSTINPENNQPKLHEYKTTEEVTRNFQGCDAFMWSKSALKSIGLLQEDSQDALNNYFKRTFITNFDECLFINTTIVENTKKYLQYHDINDDNDINIDDQTLESISNEELMLSNKYSNNTESFDTSLIIPCIDLNKYTDSCLKYILNNSTTKLQLIIIVKDEITKNGIEEIFNNFDNLEKTSVSIYFVIENVKSYSEAINLGLQQSLAKYVILMNNNIIVNTDWDKKLYESIETSKAMGIIPITNCSKNNYNNFIDITYDSIEDFFDKTSKITHLFNPILNCFQFDLFCIILNKEELYKIGGIDKNYINSTEDCDLYEMIKLFNRSVYITTQCVVYNHEITKEYSQDLTNYNEYLFEKKWNKKVERKEVLTPQITTDVYDMDIYRPSSELKKYLDTVHKKNFSSDLLNKFLKMDNGFDVDSKLYKYLNSSNLATLYNNNIYDDIQKNAINRGLIYNTKQITNYMKIDNLFIKKNIFYCYINNIYIELKLLTESVYQNTFETFMNDIIVEENTLALNNSDSSSNLIMDTNTNNSLLVSFIGDYKIGLLLINKLINSDKTDFPNVFVFKNNSVYEKLKKILRVFKQRIIIKTKEFGNDIIPTIQAVYYCLNNLNLKIDYVYKFHTKTNEIWFEALTNYLLDTCETDLINKLNDCISIKKSNCIGDEKYYLHVNNEDRFCKELIETYKDFYNKESFVSGSIFFAKASLFRNINNFIKRNNYRSFFMYNMYDTNDINIHNSPIHFLERLFGIIKT